VTGRPILTAAAMRGAEAEAIAAGTPVETLMERAGTAAAEAILRFAGIVPALVLCGPGNNGGDGYVVARRLRERGLDVRVAALGEPASPAARTAKAAWAGPVATLAEAAPAPLLVDSLFGIGLSRPLDEPAWRRLAALAAVARLRVAIDLPSGAATDDGRLLSPVPYFDLTVTFGALKPSHLLQPAARHVGRLAVADIGVDPGAGADGGLHEIGRPRLRPPGPADHKYTRGHLLVVGGAMPGAAALAASAALRSGTGYVTLAGEAGTVPDAVVRRPLAALDELLAGRLGAVLIGPGFGRDAAARALLRKAMAAPHPLLLDGDALRLAAEEGWPARPAGATVATPHAGEFAAAFGDEGGKIEAARAAASRTGAVIVYKGADTVVAGPDGPAVISAAPSHWLASAGTGDVLAGVIAGRLASGLPAFEAACAGVWLHGRAAQLAGPGLIADDLPLHLPAALASCL